VKDFQPFAFDHRACRGELDALEDLLKRPGSLSEQKDILPFFRANTQLAALLGCCFSDIVTPGRLAYEYDLFGDFACDIAVGDASLSHYSFIEMEDAGPKSLFVKEGRRSTPAWSPRFDHGFSQIIDWFWKLDDVERTDDFRARFGPEPIRYSALLIIGRGRAFGHREDRRRSWRGSRVVVNSWHVCCITFDELYEDLSRRLHFYELATSSGE
jgi:Domain of unknown function (DUF4263)